MRGPNFLPLTSWLGDELERNYQSGHEPGHNIFMVTPEVPNLALSAFNNLGNRQTIPNLGFPLRILICWVWNWVLQCDFTLYHSIRYMWFKHSKSSKRLTVKITIIWFCHPISGSTFLLSEFFWNLPL